MEQVDPDGGYAAAPSRQSVPAGSMRSALLAGVLTGELGSGPAVGASLDEAEAALGIAGCLDQVLLPTIRAVHQLVTTGRIEPPLERLATEASRAWLNWRSAFTVARHGVGQILFAGGPRDHNPLTLEALALLMRTRGWPCRLLGSRVTTRDLVTAVRASTPAAVVLLADVTSGRAQAVTSLVSVADLGHVVFFFGSALADGHDGLPGEYLRGDLGEAAARISAVLAP